MFQLWKTAEATILDTIHDFRWQKDAGLTDQSALQHLEALASGNTSSSLDSDVTLRRYVARRLAMVDPSYLPLGDEILIQQIEIAGKWVRDEIQWTKSKPGFPPIEWLKRRINFGDIDRITSGKRADWNRIKALFTEHDELWEFSSPPETWEGLAGRAGVALIRDGRSIAHVITTMN